MHEKKAKSNKESFFLTTSLVDFSFPGRCKHVCVYAQALEDIIGAPKEEERKRKICSRRAPLMLIAPDTYAQHECGDNPTVHSQIEKKR